MIVTHRLASDALLFCWLSSTIVTWPWDKVGQGEIMLLS